MKKMLTVLGTVLLAVGIIAVPTAAQANSPCMTRAEWSRIHTGMNLNQVARIVGSKGHVQLYSPPMVIRSWRTCALYHVDNVTFMYGHVSGKLYI